MDVSTAYLRDLADRLGEASPKMTGQRYAELLQAAAKVICQVADEAGLDQSKAHAEEVHTAYRMGVAEAAGAIEAAVAAAIRRLNGEPRQWGDPDQPADSE